MTFIIKLIVIAPFVAAIFLLVFLVNDRNQTVGDFETRRISYSGAYIETYGISTRYRKIRIETGTGSYYLHPFTNYLPEGMTMEEGVNLLNKSTEAVIWIDKLHGNEQLVGIKTDHLNIQPTQWLRAIAESGQFLWIFTGGCFLVGIFVYFYFKRYFDLDWRLNFRISINNRTKV